MIKFTYTIFPIFMYHFVFGNAEIFSAISHLDTLLQSEYYTIEILERFLQYEQRRIEHLRSSILEYKIAINDGLKIGTENPVQSYITMKNMFNHWSDIKTWSNCDTNKIFSNISIWRNQQGTSLPNEEDLTGSRVGLLRLQDTYNLNPADLAQGRLNPIDKMDSSLDAYDCLQLGLLHAKENDYYNTLIWMEVAKNRLDENQNDQLKMDIFEYYSFALYKQGNLERALATTNDLLTTDPDNQRFKNNAKVYKKALNCTECQNENLPPMRNIKPKKKTDNVAIVFEKYKSMCRGEFNVDTKLKSKLYCYYKNDRPFLRLAPIKVELVHTKPDIYLFKDVLSDKEIDFIQTITKPRLKRAAVSQGFGKKCKPSAARTAKNAWIKNDEYALMSIINNRVSDMTNLDAFVAEDLQVVNYGIGGHYHLHYDFFEKNLTAAAESVKTYQNIHPNDRMATVLFYMSSSTVGGATIFSEINLTIHPSKNDALFWYNLLKNGMPDLATKHSGCPVLSGSKWVANKWIRERGQEFNRQCDINETL